MASDDDHEVGSVDDWCLVCKDGGDLIECEIGNCGRVYHRNCLKPIPVTLEDWQCPRHSCHGCKRNPPVALCYSCPKACCSECLDDLGFVPIRDENGFCSLCWDLARYFEAMTKSKPKMDPDEYGLFEHCKEYYWIVKKQHGLALDDLVAVREKQRVARGRKKRTYRSLDKSDDDKAIQKKKLNPPGTSQNEVLRRDTRIPALTPDNVRRIYLTRNVVQKLLMEPDSFEEKVRRAFVGIELPRKPKSNKTVRQLVQITGITKTSLKNDQICIKLQAKDRQDDISIDMVSDMDFLEIVCQDLRQQVKDGLIEMPDLEEFKRMAKVLSEVLVDDYIVRETRLTQERMSRANEKGRRDEFLLLAQKKKDLQTYTKKLQLISFFQEVGVEEVSADTLPENNKVNSDDIMHGKNQKDAPKLLHQDWPALELKRDKSSGCHSKQHGMKWTEYRQVVDGNKTVEVTMPINTADDKLIPADHFNVQSSGVEKECDEFLLSRYVLVEQRRVDVMLEEFENNCHVVKDKQVEKYTEQDEVLSTEGSSVAARLARLEQKVEVLSTEGSSVAARLASLEQKVEVLSTEGSSVAARLASLEQKVDRILQHLVTTEDGAKKSV